jgi:hypothetical protein
MASVRTVEKTISRVEGFAVRMRHLNGRDVRSDRTNLPPYPFRRAMKSSAHVGKWKSDRFATRYPGFDVDVVAPDGRAVHGRTLLSTVRDMYLEN